MKRPPLRILESCFSLSWGGLEIQALDEASLLIERGHCVTLACTESSRVAEEASRRRIPPLPASVTGYIHPRAVLKLSRFLRQEAVQIVHCQLSKDIATIVPALRLGGSKAPLVLSRRMGSGISKKDFFHRLTYGRVNTVIAISNVIHQNVLATTPVSPTNVVTIHHGIDTTAFSLNESARKSIRKEFSFNGDHLVVGFVGRFSPGKGHEEFFSAAATLTPKYPNVRFLVVGEASAGEEDYALRMRGLASSLGLDPVLGFAGFRSDVAAVMSSFDIFAFPSHAESFGAVLIEAMAMERPVVASRSDGVLDIVVDGETGILVRPRDAVALAQGIETLIMNPGQRIAFGTAGRQRVLRHFDRTVLGDRLEDVYYGLLTRNPG